ncbi:putative nucleotidyltransferase [Arcicella rosea]|uniref:hypothetical protein n=1 Tax=Arcicella rosea TaxID=502909 RepID=UPI00345DAB79
MTEEEIKEIIKRADTFEKRLIFTQKYLFHGIPEVFRNREDDYFEFRNRIANKFNVGFHEVFIVGSAKLGFSYFKGTQFNYDSDIDVVIVNEKLFETFYLKISDYQYQLDRQQRTVALRELNIYNKFLKYLVKGWMRPDKLPTSFQVDLLKSEWFNFFESLSYNRSEVGNYKVSAGLFKNYDYLEKYYTKSVEDYYYSITKN